MLEQILVCINLLITGAKVEIKNFLEGKLPNQLTNYTYVFDTYVHYTSIIKII